MDIDRAETIIDLALGMKRWEWNRINHMVEQAFRNAEARMEFTPELARSAKTLLRLENGTKKDG